MEIKIQCNCGTKFKFEFDPVDGRVPFEVKCPGCGIDATETANSHVQQMLGATVSAEPVAAAPTGSKLRVRVHVPEPVASSAPAVSPSPAPAPRAFTPAPVAAYNPPDEGLSPKFFLGLLGAALGVFVGCTIWYLVFHFTDKNYRAFALLVAIAGGFGAKLMSKDEGSSQLGMITAVFTLVGVVFTAYFIGRAQVHDFVDFEGSFYEEQVAYAKRAVNAVPKGTEEEIRLFLAKEEVYDDEKPEPESVDAMDVRLFQDVHLGHYKELASGRIKEADFSKTQQRWRFDEQVAQARYTLEAMPNESDAEIRAYLAKEYEAGREFFEEKVNPNDVPIEDVKRFRAGELAELKALASGQKKMEEIEMPEDYQTAEEALTKAEEENAWIKFLYFFSGWGIGGIGIMFVTLGLAYKIAAHE